MQTIELNELHTEHMQIYDTMTIFREILSNSLEIYNSNLSIEMNRIIQRLTIVGSFILLPTLINIYGMNLGWSFNLQYAWIGNTDIYFL